MRLNIFRQGGRHFDHGPHLVEHSSRLFFVLGEGEALATGDAIQCEEQQRKGCHEFGLPGLPRHPQQHAAEQAARHEIDFTRVRICHFDADLPAHEKADDHLFPECQVERFARETILGEHEDFRPHLDDGLRLVVIVPRTLLR